MQTLLMIAAVASLSTSMSQAVPPTAPEASVPPAAPAPPAAPQASAPSPPADATVAATPVVATRAATSLDESTWTFTRKGKKTQQSIDAGGNYVATSGSDHVDHGTSAMVDGKICFTSAMGDKGTTCWTKVDAAIGASVRTTSDKGEKLKVTRVAYVPAPPMK